VGIPDLWLKGWTTPPSGGRKKLPGLGPIGTEEMMSRLEKLNTGISAEAVAVIAKDFSEGIIYEENGVRVTAFRVKHGEIKEAFGFRVDYRGHAVVISGDTGPSENFVKYAEGADVVVHEVGVARSELLDKAIWARQIMTLHSSPELIVYRDA
jgi:ribonuclease Z